MPLRAETRVLLHVIASATTIASRANVSWALNLTGNGYLAPGQQQSCVSPCSSYHAGASSADWLVCQYQASGVGTVESNSAVGTACYPAYNCREDWNVCIAKHKDAAAFSNTPLANLNDPAVVEAACAEIANLQKGGNSGKIPPPGDWQPTSLGWMKATGNIECGYGSTYSVVEPNSLLTLEDFGRLSFDGCSGADAEKLCCIKAMEYEGVPMSHGGAAVRFNVFAQRCVIDREMFLRGNLDSSGGRSNSQIDACGLAVDTFYWRHASGAADASNLQSAGRCVATNKFTRVSPASAYKPQGRLPEGFEIPNDECWGTDVTNPCMESIRFNSIFSAEQCCEQCASMAMVSLSGNGAETITTDADGKLENPCVAFQIVDGKCRILRERWFRKRYYAANFGLVNGPGNQPMTITETIGHCSVEGDACLRFDNSHGHWASCQGYGMQYGIDDCSYYSHMYYRDPQNTTILNHSGAENSSYQKVQNTTFDAAKNFSINFTAKILQDRSRRDILTNATSGNNIAPSSSGFALQNIQNGNTCAQVALYPKTVLTKDSSGIDMINQELDTRPLLSQRCCHTGCGIAFNFDSRTLSREAGRRLFFGGGLDVILSYECEGAGKDLCDFAGQISEWVEEVEETVEETGETIGETVEEAGETIGETVEEAGETINEVAEGLENTTNGLRNRTRRFVNRTKQFKRGFVKTLKCGGVRLTSSKTWSVWTSKKGFHQGHVAIIVLVSVCLLGMLCALRPKTGLSKDWRDSNFLIVAPDRISYSQPAGPVSRLCSRIVNTCKEILGELLDAFYQSLSFWIVPIVAAAGILCPGCTKSQREALKTSTVMHARPWAASALQVSSADIHFLLKHEEEVVNIEDGQEILGTIRRATRTRIEDVSCISLPGLFLILFFYRCPVTSLWSCSLRLPTMVRVFLLWLWMVSVLVISSLLMSTSGSALSADSHHLCQVSGTFATLGNKLAGSLLANLLGNGIPKLLVFFFYSRDFEIVQNSTEATRRLRCWRILSIVFWVVGLAYGVLCVLLIATFVTSVRSQDAAQWVVLARFSLFLDGVVFPACTALVSTVILAGGSRAVHRDVSRMMVSVRTTFRVSSALRPSSRPSPAAETLTKQEKETEELADTLQDDSQHLAIDVKGDVSSDKSLLVDIEDGHAKMSEEMNDAKEQKVKTDAGVSADASTDASITPEQPQSVTQIPTLEPSPEPSPQSDTGEHRRKAPAPAPAAPAAAPSRKHRRQRSTIDGVSGRPKVSKKISDRRRLSPISKRSTT